jgi:hypothetical protein
MNSLFNILWIVRKLILSSTSLLGHDDLGSMVLKVINMHGMSEKCIECIRHIKLARFTTIYEIVINLDIHLDQCFST